MSNCIKALWKRTKAAIDEFLACAWCGEIQANCICDPDVDWVDPETD